MSITFTPIPACADTQPFAECRGVDLSRDLAAHDVERIRVGLLEHGLLLFPDQRTMTPEREVAFNEAFGWHDPDQDRFIFGFGADPATHQRRGGGQLPALPQVSLIGNVRLDGYHGVDDTQLVLQLGLSRSGWHCDGLHDMLDGLPELTTMYNPVGWSTGGGGETYFTSGVRALERLDPALVDELSGCIVAYVRCPNDELPDEARRVFPGPACMADEGIRRIGFARDATDPSAGMVEGFELEMSHAEGGGRHPLVRTHPETGERALYVTPSYALYLIDAETGAVRHGIDDTLALITSALAPSVAPGVRYEHRWREGDLVAWLNTTVLHSATDPTDVVGPRLMHRVRLSTPRHRCPTGKPT